MEGHFLIKQLNVHIIVNSNMHKMIFQIIENFLMQIFKLNKKKFNCNSNCFILYLLTLINIIIYTLLMGNCKNKIEALDI